MMNTPDQTLDDILRDVEHRLTAAAEDRQHPMHIAALASLGTTGYPRVRSVVLREVSAALRQIAFHTDRRSEKYAELCAEPRCSLHFYAPDAKVQIRLEGRAEVHSGDALAEAAWNASQRMSRECYRVLPAPGTAISSHANLQREADDATAFAHFARVMVNVQVIEWLWLAAAGHRRARFVQEFDRWTGVWLVP